jgi:hypothetical protein
MVLSPPAGSVLFERGIKLSGSQILLNIENLANQICKRQENALVLPLIERGA